MHAYLSDVVANAHRADLLSEGALWRETSRRGQYVRAPRAARALGEWFAAWTSSRASGRTAIACCPA